MCLCLFSLLSTLLRFVFGLVSHFVGYKFPTIANSNPDQPFPFQIIFSAIVWDPQ